MNGLRRPTRLRFFVVAFSVVSVTAATIVVMGTSGYLLFYDLNLSDANVLDLFPEGDRMVIVVRVVMALNIVLSIPYALFMPRGRFFTLG